MYSHQPRHSANSQPYSRLGHWTVSTTDDPAHRALADRRKARELGGRSLRTSFHLYHLACPPHVSRYTLWFDANTDHQASSLTLPSLSKPLRPFWTHPATRTPPTIEPDAPFTPVICVSASKWVGSEDDVPAVTRVQGGRTVGFSYVQGAGDDDELWSRVCLVCSWLCSIITRCRDSLGRLRRTELTCRD